MFDPQEIKSQFPIFNRQINGHPLTYLDTAATAQKPQVVIDEITDYYTNHNANVARGLHTLGLESSDLYQQAREEVAAFFGASANELIFTKNTTDGMNLLRYTWGMNQVHGGEYIITSLLEHHSNLVVWQELAKATGAQLVLIQVTEAGEIDVADLELKLKQLGNRVKLVSLSHLSNVTGSLLDVVQVGQWVRRYCPQAKLVIDAAQSAPQLPINFAKLPVDGLCFSGHKLYGPMGIGGLLIKESWLSNVSPYKVGGGMVEVVEDKSASYASGIDRFDAGTPDVASAVGVLAAVKFLQSLGMESVEQHSRELVAYCLQELSKVAGVQIIGPTDPAHRLGSVAFVWPGVAGHDIAQVLDASGIAVRSGHHCAQPLHMKLEWSSSVRVSFGVYSQRSDVDLLVARLQQLPQILKK